MNGTAGPPFDVEVMGRLMDAVASPGYGVFPDALSPEIRQELMDLMAAKVAEETLERAGVGAGPQVEVRPEIRSDSILWLEESDPAPVVRAWLAAMSSLCEHFRRDLFLPLWSYEGHLACYPPGGFYRAHLDRHARTQARQISVIVYLNEGWQESDGGELRIFTDIEKGVEGPFIDVVPHAGTVVIFRSGDFWHEVRPAGRERLSLTGWLRGREELPLA